VHTSPVAASAALLAYLPNPMADAIGYMLSPHPRLDPIAEDVSI
jgi:hypothetical protein